MSCRSRLHWRAASILTVLLPLQMYAAVAGSADYPVTAAPGIPIFQQDHAGRPARCTLGFAASTANGAHLAVTAGHCGTVGAVVMTTGGRSIGRYIRTRPDTGPNNDGYALIALDNDVAMSANITPEFALEKQDRASIGDAVCLFGTTSGMRCGTVQEVAEEFGTITGLISAPGDSGAPVVRTKDHAITGILLGHSTTTQTTIFEHVGRIEDLAVADSQALRGLGPVVS